MYSAWIEPANSKRSSFLLASLLQTFYVQVLFLPPHIPPAPKFILFSSHCTDFDLGASLLTLLFTVRVHWWRGSSQNRKKKIILFWFFPPLRFTLNIDLTHTHTLFLPYVRWVWSDRKSKSLSRVLLFATPWTVACQAPLSVGFSRQEYWSG